MNWSDRITLLSVNPDIASRDEVARLAADLMEARSKIADLQRELAFYFGGWHGMADHQLDALCCRENECERIKNLLNQR